MSCHVGAQRHYRPIPATVAASGPILIIKMPVRPQCPASVPPGQFVLFASLITLAACTANSAPDEAKPQRRPVTTAHTDTEPTGPPGVFVTLEPWGELSFSHGRFQSGPECNAHVRSSGSYSFYTSPERCEPVIDPVFCTVWRDENDDRDSIRCHKGPGGCEIDLARHDLRVESGTRTLTLRCDPFSQDAAWERYLAATS